MLQKEVTYGMAPIIEAVLDIDCEPLIPIGNVDVEKAAAALFEPEYPILKKRFLEQHQFQTRGEEPSVHSTNRALQAIQYHNPAGNQLVQVRSTGFSFNRLAPYSSLDDYLPEIERTWMRFVELARPTKITSIKLRYINRISLPLTGGQLDLSVYLSSGPKIALENNFTVAQFLTQYSGIESNTGIAANVILTTHPPLDLNLPLILDVTVDCQKNKGVDWIDIISNIALLRSLKNRIFENTLTTKCKQLFNPSESKS